MILIGSLWARFHGYPSCWRIIRSSYFYRCTNRPFCSFVVRYRQKNIACSFTEIITEISWTTDKGAANIPFIAWNWPIRIRTSIGIEIDFCSPAGRYREFKYLVLICSLRTRFHGYPSYGWFIRGCYSNRCTNRVLCVFVVLHRQINLVSTLAEIMTEVSGVTNIATTDIPFIAWNWPIRIRTSIGIEIDFCSPAGRYREFKYLVLICSLRTRFHGYPSYGWFIRGCYSNRCTNRVLCVFVVLHRQINLVSTLAEIMMEVSGVTNTATTDIPFIAWNWPIRVRTSIGIEIDFCSPAGRHREFEDLVLISGLWTWSHGDPCGWRFIFHCCGYNNRSANRVFCSFVVYHGQENIISTFTEIIRIEVAFITRRLTVNQPQITWNQAIRVRASGSREVDISSPARRHRKLKHFILICGLWAWCHGYPSDGGFIFRCYFRSYYNRSADRVFRSLIVCYCQENIISPFAEIIRIKVAFVTSRLTINQPLIAWNSAVQIRTSGGREVNSSSPAGRYREFKHLILICSLRARFHSYPG